MGNSTKGGPNEVGENLIPQRRLRLPNFASRLPMAMVIAIGSLLLATAGCADSRAKREVRAAVEAGALLPENARRVEDFFEAFVDSCETDLACMHDAPTLADQVEDFRASSGEIASGIRFKCSRVNIPDDDNSCIAKLDFSGK